MDISGVAGLSTALPQAQAGNELSVRVLKKALDAQSQGALQLIQALPQPQPVSNPAHLGQNVDVKA